MTLTQAIERAKSALEQRILMTDHAMIPKAKEQLLPFKISALENRRRLDTEALATLREWKPEEGLQDAVHLARTLWEQHYKEECPDWEPLSTITGVLSQISNMTAGIAEKLASANSDNLATQCVYERQRDALKALTEHYVSLVNSGDAGNWNPEEELVVRSAREALEPSPELKR